MSVIASPPLPEIPLQVPVRPDSTLLLKDLPAFRRDSLAFWLSTGSQAPVVKIRFGPLERYVVNDADIAERILLKNAKNYTKDQRLARALAAGSGKVLALSDGDDWRWRRRLMQPAFRRARIARFADIIVSETEKHTAEWSKGETIDLSEAMKNLTMGIIGPTMFDVDFADATDLHHAYSNLGKVILGRIEKFFITPLWIPTRANRAFTDAYAVISHSLKRIIAERRGSLEPRGDLLEMLLQARLEDSEHKFTEEQLIHEMSAIVFAGHETTATALTWALYLLARHPQVEARLREELDRVLGNRKVRMEDADRLVYLNQVIKETMRYYPPLYVISRQAREADRLGDYALPAGGRVLLNILGIHRSAKYWDNPDQFDPDRFAPENEARLHKYAYIPFLEGGRKCIGAPLAMAELQLILPTILQRFTLQTLPGFQVRPHAAITLSPRDGLPMIPNKRA